MAAANVPGTPAPESGPRGVRVAFTGDDGEFRRLVTRGGLLELATFGFYRFWLATNIRRHIWSSTSAGTDVLEYTGTGRELFIGFLFALAILMPIYLAYFALGVEAERWQAFASFPLVIALYGFMQFAIFRARRYRLTRTIWRGVRFWMTGSGTAYASRALGWTLLTVLTLGFAYPWRASALERYKMGHTFYGDLPGRFESNGWDFFKRGWWLWLLTALVVVAIIYTLASVPYTAPQAPAASGVPTVPPKIGESPNGTFGLGQGLALFGSILAVPFIYASFESVEWKWWAEGLHLGDGRGALRFCSDLRPGQFAVTIWKMIGVSLTVSLAFGALAALAAFGVERALGLSLIRIDAGHVSPAIAFFVLIAAGYLGFLVAFGAVWRIYMIQRIWKLVVSSISIENLSAADHVVAKGESASALGEGLADSLDVAGF
ncbi:MAG: DUF898 domain-containing protein [Beijerinckiaceae bacterium]|nr:DUF898 domain-containing protein [Beijerinckiaceae bacterium]MCI0737134.1 DUF898 domain-containing protein [Beijerinckiaceae bacterium]